MLIEIDDAIFNTAQMRKVEYLSGTQRDRRAEITWADGSTEIVEDCHSKIARSSGQYIPAGPGFWRIAAWQDKGEIGFIEPEPVIGFRITGDSEFDVIPITPSGEQRRGLDAKQHWALVLPNGQCFDVEDGPITSVDEWKTKVREELASRAEKRKPVAAS